MGEIITRAGLAAKDGYRRRLQQNGWYEVAKIDGLEKVRKAVSYVI
jgi:hypothetical protein